MSRAYDRREKLWNAVAELHKLMDKTGYLPTQARRANWLPLKPRSEALHYEYRWRPKLEVIEVALDFELNNQQRSMDCMAALDPHLSSLEAGAKYPLRRSSYGSRSASIRFEVPYDGADGGEAAIAEKVVPLMQQLITHTRTHIRGDR
jgi:hypothetical protein